ncbi:AGC/PDK1 protein kinase Ksg1 [Schizosaccharomyces cryophilus OY26]|uniref:non-specific serine/threonine protein kinase n=1 Tax=Schizosaccharomyces cryophilus (strain OY26 / ATCC MYA-4695 / CBS 11777 / NBRC 106824 / NRRL Y48691) TaxID=653667 RepID=S9VZL6_SCHCR|nr:AGC/PDK1 protein kinase Ksg1 [Schizosaccharomyces cryophilus OY26]EPY51260.1 AGC/PDK1 protein kinase Ksg1 [Schizosaccharomyces cryophilus OY26]
MRKSQNIKGNSNSEDTETELQDDSSFFSVEELNRRLNSPYALGSSDPKTTPSLPDPSSQNELKISSNSNSTKNNLLPKATGTSSPSSRATSPNNIKRVSDFSFGEIIGEGSYSTVLSATENNTKREYAIKVLDKRHIIKEKKVKYVNIEKEALYLISKHPGFIRLYYTFQDTQNLYFVFSLARNGELLDYINKLGRFNEACVQYYGALLLDSIDFMHKQGVIHRDLKPENILLDDNMKTKIIDFGSAKIQKTVGKDESLPDDLPINNNHSRSFVGTARYVSPEVLNDKNASTASDVWAFGCILFQMLTGKPPFIAGNEYLVFQKILHLSYEVPVDISETASDLIKKILILDPSERLTTKEIRNHPFFSAVRFDKTLWEIPPPRLKPAGHTSTLSLSVPSFVPKSTGDPNDQTRPSTLSVSSAYPTPNTPINTAFTLSSPPELEEMNKRWHSVLLEDEKISKITILNVSSMPGSGSHEAVRFFSSLFRKKRPRTFILTTFGRCLLVAMDNGGKATIKEELPIKSVGLRVRSVKNSNHTWIMETPTKSWSFEDPREAASTWIDLINKATSVTTSFENHSVTSFSRSIARSVS